MNIEATVERFIINEITMGAQTKIEPDQSLLGSGILDSLALIRLIAFVEEQFGVTIDDGEVIPDNFETIGDIKALVENKVQTQ